MKQPPVQNVLVQSGIVDADGLARALEIQGRDGGSLGRIIADLGLSTEDAVARAVAGSLGLEYVNRGEIEPPTEADLCLPPEFCRQRRVLPLGVKDRALRLAMADPLDLGTLQDVEFRTSKRVAAVAAAESAILDMLKRLYPDPDKIGMSYDLMSTVNPEGELVTSNEDEYEVVDPAELAKDVKLPPIVRLVNLVLTDAAKAGASDIHIEPQETGLQVRQRIDGMLRDVLKIPRHLQAAVVSRLKIISGMDIAERRKPRDGRSRLRVQQRKIDLRVSTLPTNYGEKVVILLLDGANARTDMGRLGFAPELLKRFQDLPPVCRTVSR